MATTLTIKNIPEDLYEQLKKSARDHRRSINSEVLVCLERSLRSNRVELKTFLERVRKLRRATARLPLSDDLLHEARNEGRG